MSNLNLTQNIFIGGTGRSGTTILSKTLNQLDDIYTIPQEIRFITDPDGLISLEHSLVSDWSKFHSDLAMERFLNLMENLKTRYKGRYPNHGISELITDDFYQSWVTEFSNYFISYKIKDGWAARVNLLNKTLLNVFGKNSFTELFLEHSYYCKPHSINTFLEVSGKFVQDFFNQVRLLNNAKIIVEHTPSNLIHSDFILKMVPNSKLIHIYRDPRDVLCSYKVQDWGSSHLENNIEWLNDIFYQWNLKKESLKPNQFIEIAFEELIFSYDATIEKISDYLGINSNGVLPKINLSKHNIGRWKTELNEKEKIISNNKLKNIINDYGYNL